MTGSCVLDEALDVGVWESRETVSASEIECVDGECIVSETFGDIVTLKLFRVGVTAGERVTGSDEVALKAAVAETE